jgi:hypothetical protein
VRVFLQCPEDGLDHAFGVRENIVVPEPDDAPALALQENRTALVRFIVCLLAAIRFND